MPFLFRFGFWVSALGPLFSVFLLRYSSLLWFHDLSVRDSWAVSVLGGLAFCLPLIRRHKRSWIWSPGPGFETLEDFIVDGQSDCSYYLLGPPKIPASALFRPPKPLLLINFSPCCFRFWVLCSFLFLPTRLPSTPQLSFLLARSLLWFSSLISRVLSRDLFLKQKMFQVCRVILDSKSLNFWTISFWVFST